MKRRLLAAILLALWALGGCAAYRFGGPEEGLVRPLFIAPVENETETPQVRALLTQQLRRTFAQGGQWRLAAEEDGAYVLAVRLTQARQRIGATREDDTGRGLSFTTSLIAEATLLHPDGTLTTLAPVTESGLLFEVPGQPEVATQSLPSITLRLAEQIHRLVTYP
jgi:hypothetical protein